MGEGHRPRQAGSAARAFFGAKTSKVAIAIQKQQKTPNADNFLNPIFCRFLSNSLAIWFATPNRNSMCAFLGRDVLCNCKSQSLRDVRALSESRFTPIQLAMTLLETFLSDSWRAHTLRTRPPKRVTMVLNLN